VTLGYFKDVATVSLHTDRRTSLPFRSGGSTRRIPRRAVRSGKVGRTIRFLILLLQLWQHQATFVSVS
jgi:hypothetical protein